MSETIPIKYRQVHNNHMDIEREIPTKSKISANRMEIRSYGGQVGGQVGSQVGSQVCSQVGSQVGGQEAISEIKLRKDFGKISE